MPNTINKSVSLHKKAQNRIKFLNKISRIANYLAAKALFKFINPVFRAVLVPKTGDAAEIIKGTAAFSCPIYHSTMHSVIWIEIAVLI